MELIGPYLAACLLLVAAGAAKVARPDDTARAVTAVVSMPLRRLRAVVRVGAAAEAALGAIALVFPSPVTAGLVAASYLGFAGFVALARARGGPLATCGCFSTPDTPATRTHVALTLGFAVSAAGVAAGVSAGWITHVLGDEPWRGVPVALLGVLCAWLAYLAMTRLATLGATRRALGIARGASA
jgi:uncharacterized protein YjeT (DUF2065 family)